MNNRRTRVSILLSEEKNTSTYYIQCTKILSRVLASALVMITRIQQADATQQILLKLLRRWRDKWLTLDASSSIYAENSRGRELQANPIHDIFHARAYENKSRFLISPPSSSTLRARQTCIHRYTSNMRASMFIYSLLCACFTLTAYILYM